MYTQIGLAFVGGVIFGVILIPITRWLANKISLISKEFLEAKDARVSLTYETLAGAKQIKILAWEDIFIEKIQSKRHRFYFVSMHIQMMEIFTWDNFRYEKIGNDGTIKTKIFGCIVRIFLGHNTDDY